MSLEGEMRPADAAQDIAGSTAEVAALLEYIRDTNPQWERERLLNVAIDAIDDTHELAVKTQIELEE